MEVFVRKGSSSDITQGMDSYPIYYKTSLLIFNFLLFSIFLAIAGYFFWDMLPANTTISNITEILAEMMRKGVAAKIYGLGGSIVILVALILRMIFFFFKNRTPQCVLSASGITFRDGTLLPWEEITENVYTEYEELRYKSANGILIRSRDRKWGITWPSVNAKEYLSLCDHYTNHKGE